MRRQPAGLPLLLIGLLVGLVVGLASPHTAHADNVDTLVKQLGDSNSKVRLSAALSLAKVGGDRAVPPFVKALANDGDKNVRATVAAGLGKLVTPQTKAAQKTAIVAALTKALKDEAELVRKQAEKSLADINGGKAGDAGGIKLAAGSIYVEIGPMAAASKDHNYLLDVMRKAVKTGLDGSGMVMGGLGGKSPTKAQLEAKNVAAFYVDGTISTVAVKGDVVSCKVKMLIATYPDKSMFGFLNGGASVEGGSSPEDIQTATNDCVAAVVEDLATKRMVPAIKAKASQ